MSLDAPLEHAARGAARGEGGEVVVAMLEASLEAGSMWPVSTHKKLFSSFSTSQAHRAYRL
jgi:hypothetical protein